MPKLQTQSTEELKQERIKARANLLYVRGISKLKKDELNNKYKEISNINDRRNNNNDTQQTEFIDNSKQDDLEDEIEKIKSEIQKLESTEIKIQNDIKYTEDKIQLDELSEEETEQQEETKIETDDEEQEETKIETDDEEEAKIETDEDDENTHKEEQKTLNKYVEETIENVKEINKRKQEQKQETDEDEDEEEEDTIKKYEEEIKDMMSEFEENITDLLLEFNHIEKLTKKDIKEINDYHKESIKLVKYNLKKIYEEMDDNDEFPNSFYRWLDKIFEDTEDLIYDFIS